MAPVILAFDVDCKCNGCANKIRKTLKKIVGVDDVTADVDARLVVVEGTASAEWLKYSLEKKMKKLTVTIVSDDKDRAAQSSSAPPSRPAPSSPPHRAPPPVPRSAAPSSPPHRPPPPVPTSPPPVPSSPLRRAPPSPPREAYPPMYMYGNGSYYQPYSNSEIPSSSQYGGYQPYSYGETPSSSSQWQPAPADYDPAYGGNYAYYGSSRDPHRVANDAPSFFSDENPNAHSIQ